MSRFIIAIAIIIPLATVLFVSTNSSKKSNDSSEASEVADLDVQETAEEKAEEVEKHFTVEVTSDNFEQLVRKSEQPVVLDFWASWCQPCMMLSPHMDEIGEEYKDVAFVGKINFDEQPELADLEKVTGIPCVLIYKGGELIDRIEGYEGAKTLDRIRAAINSQLEL